MSKQATVTLTAEYLGTKRRVTMIFYPRDDSWVEERRLGTLVDRLSRDLFQWYNAESGPREWVQLFDPDAPKLRSIDVPDEEHVDPETLAASQRKQVRGEPEPMLIGAEDDGVLNCGDGLYVIGRDDAAVYGCESIKELFTLLDQAFPKTFSTDPLDIDGPVRNSDETNTARNLLRNVRFSASELVAQVRDIQARHNHKRTAGEGE